MIEFKMGVNLESGKSCEGCTIQDCLIYNTVLHVIFDYPFTKPFKEVYRSEEGFTLTELVALIHGTYTKMYEKFYKPEERAAGLPVPILHRLGELIIEVIYIDGEDVTLVIGS